VQAGALLGVERIATGWLHRSGETTAVHVAVVNVETGAIEWGVTHTCACGDDRLVDLGRALGGRLTAGAGGAAGP
jgi:hypothetical protein